MTGGAPPPPPPGCPPPPPVLDMSQMNFDDSDHDRSALFAQINKGQDITSSTFFFSPCSIYFIFGFILGLKKVTSEMQTHKNPSLRSGPAPFKAPTANGGSPAANKAPVVKPPVMVKDGKKWMVVCCIFYVSRNGMPTKCEEINKRDLVNFKASCQFQLVI